MRRLILAIAATCAASLALAGCDNGPHAKLEREVNAALAELDLPERPTFPSVNADTIDRLSEEMPELAAHRAAIAAADEAILARAAGELARLYPADGTPVAVAMTAAPLPSPGLAQAIVDLIAPPAHARSMDGASITSSIAGMSAAVWMGGIADGLGGKPGEAVSHSDTINGSNGEKAVITVDRDANGVVTSSMESNVDAVPLGIMAGSKTTLITKSLCPDASGRVEFTIKLSQSGKAGGLAAAISAAGGGAAFDSEMEAHVVLHTDDQAEIADQDIRIRYSRKASGKAGGTSYSGEVDWRRDGDGRFDVVDARRGAETGSVTEAMETSAITAATALALGAMQTAESRWQTGNCIALQAQSPGRVDPKAKTDIPVSVRSKSDQGPVAARVTATLTGGESISPAVIDRTPGTIVHTAPNEKKARMSIRLDAVSRRGKATLTLDLLISEGAYSIEGGADEFHGTGLICDIGQPFTVEGNGVTVNFTPSSPQGGSYRYSGSMYGFRLSGNGTYTVTYNGDVATGIVATGPGSVGTAYGTVSGSGDEHYELTPSHNYRCE